MPTLPIHTHLKATYLECLVIRNICLFLMQNLNLPDYLICCSMLNMYVSYLNICCKFTKPLLSFCLLVIHSQEQKLKKKKKPWHEKENKPRTSYNIISRSFDQLGFLEFFQVDFPKQIQDRTDPHTYPDMIINCKTVL